MSTPVLIVDDSAMSRKLTQRALPAEWDVEVRHAAGGEEALAACRAGQGAVMFLDLTMPGMSGFDVLEALLREEVDSFVIVVSADVQPGAEARALELGARSFLRKPVQAEAVRATLDEHGLLPPERSV